MQKLKAGSIPFDAAVAKIKASLGDHTTLDLTEKYMGDAGTTAIANARLNTQSKPRPFLFSVNLVLILWTLKPLGYRLI